MEITNWCAGCGIEGHSDDDEHGNDLLPQLENKILIVTHGNWIDIGVNHGIMKGRETGSHFDRQPKLVLQNGTTAVHIALDEIKEYKVSPLSPKPERMKDAH